jgi:hypothetical protein
MVFTRFLVQFVVGLAVMVFAMTALATQGFKKCQVVPAAAAASKSAAAAASSASAAVSTLQCTSLGRNLSDALLEGIFLPIITGINAYFMPTPGRSTR